MNKGQSQPLSQSRVRTLGKGQDGTEPGHGPRAVSGPCGGVLGFPLGVVTPAHSQTTGEPSVALGKICTCLPTAPPVTRHPLLGTCCPCSPARRMGPLSVLPPKPNLSQNGGAQWASQWQFLRLLHTCPGSGGGGHRERGAALEPALHVGRW